MSWYIISNVTYLPVILYNMILFLISVEVRDLYDILGCLPHDQAFVVVYYILW